MRRQVVDLALASLAGLTALLGFSRESLAAKEHSQVEIAVVVDGKAVDFTVLGADYTTKKDKDKVPKLFSRDGTPLDKENVKLNKQLESVADEDFAFAQVTEGLKLATTDWLVVARAADGSLAKITDLEPHGAGIKTEALSINDKDTFTAVMRWKLTKNPAQMLGDGTGERCGVRLELYRKTAETAAYRLVEHTSDLSCVTPKFSDTVFELETACKLIHLDNINYGDGNFKFDLQTFDMSDPPIETCGKGLVRHLDDDDENIAPHLDLYLQRGDVVFTEGEIAALRFTHPDYLDLVVTESIEWLLNKPESHLVSSYPIRVDGEVTMLLPSRHGAAPPSHARACIYLSGQLYQKLRRNGQTPDPDDRCGIGPDDALGYLCELDRPLRWGASAVARCPFANIVQGQDQLSAKASVRVFDSETPTVPSVCWFDFDGLRSSSMCEAELHTMSGVKTYADSLSCDVDDQMNCPIGNRYFREPIQPLIHMKIDEQDFRGLSRYVHPTLVIEGRKRWVERTLWFRRKKPRHIPTGVIVMLCNDSYQCVGQINDTIDKDESSVAVRVYGPHMYPGMNEDGHYVDGQATRAKVHTHEFDVQVDTADWTGGTNMSAGLSGSTDRRFGWLSSAALDFEWIGGPTGVGLGVSGGGGNLYGDDLGRETFGYVFGTFNVLSPAWLVGGHGRIHLRFSAGPGLMISSFSTTETELRFTALLSGVVMFDLLSKYPGRLALTVQGDMIATRDRVLWSAPKLGLRLGLF